MFDNNSLDVFQKDLCRGVLMKEYKFHNSKCFDHNKDRHCLNKYSWYVLLYIAKYKGLHLFPSLRAFWFLEKAVLNKIIGTVVITSPNHVSGNCTSRNQVIWVWGLGVLNLWYHNLMFVLLTPLFYKSLKKQTQKYFFGGAWCDICCAASRIEPMYIIVRNI